MGEARVRAAYNAKRVVVPKPLHQTLVLDMAEPRRKLASQLAQRLDGYPILLLYPTISLYGRYLARIMNPELVPSGFVTACWIALANIKHPRRYDPVPSEFNDLTAMPPVFYGHLEELTHQIAQAVTPPDFAEQVRVCIEAFKLEAP